MQTTLIQSQNQFISLTVSRTLTKPTLCRREHQSRMFAGMLTTLVKNIDDVDKVVPVLHGLATRHVAYGVQEAHFPVVGAGLLATLEKVLGPDYTAPVREAWTELYGITQTVRCQYPDFQDLRVHILSIIGLHLLVMWKHDQWGQPLHDRIIFEFFIT